MHTTKTVRIKKNQHHIVPVIFTPADIERNRSWEWWVRNTFRDVRDWYQKVLGRTFRIKANIVVGRRTRQEYLDIPGSTEKWYAAMQDAQDQGELYVCDDTHLYYLVTQEQWATGGMVGSENFYSPSGEPCNFIIPGKACATGPQGSVIGNQPAPPDMEWWFDERREGAGAVAHEIGHALAQDMHHGTWEEPPSIMLQWWDFPGVGFRDREKERLLTEEVPRLFLT